jgi:hypothetical protein
VIRLFSDNRVWVLFLLPVFLGIYYLEIGILHPNLFLVKIRDQHDFWFAPIHWARPLILLGQFGLILLNSIVLNWVFNSHEFLDKNAFLISLNYLIFSSFFVPFGNPEWILCAHFFSILALASFFQIRQNTDARKQIFNASLFLGIAALFEPYLLYLIAFVWWMIFSIRPFNFREWFLSVIGLLLPLSYWMLTSYLCAWQLNWKALLPPLTFAPIHWLNWSIFGVFILLSVVSLLGLNTRLNKASLRLKKQIQLFNVFFISLVVIGGFLFVASGNFSLFSFIILPISFYFTYAIMSSGYGILAHLLFYGVLLFSFANFVILYQL